MTSPVQSSSSRSRDRDYDSLDRNRRSDSRDFDKDRTRDEDRSRDYRSSRDTRDSYDRRSPSRSDYRESFRYGDSSSNSRHGDSYSSNSRYSDRDSYRRRSRSPRRDDSRPYSSSSRPTEYEKSSYRARDTRDYSPISSSRTSSNHREFTAPPAPFSYSASTANNYSQPASSQAPPLPQSSNYSSSYSTSSYSRPPMPPAMPWKDASNSAPPSAPYNQGYSAPHSAPYGQRFDSRGASSSMGYTPYGDSGFGSFSNLNRQDWSNMSLVPFEKNFYREHPDVKARSESEINAYRDLHAMSVFGSNIPKPVHNFDEGCFPEYISKMLSGQGFSTPTAIQAQV